MAEVLPAAGKCSPYFAGLKLDVFAKPASGGVITLNSNASVGDACATLSHNNILCCPVIDETQPADAGWSDRVIGVVDFLSLVAWMVDEVGEDIPSSFQGLMSHRATFKTTTIKQLMDANKRWIPFVPVDGRVNNALDVLNLLGKYGLHRVCEVTSPGGSIVNIITQSSVVRLLHEHLGEKPLSEVATRSLDELGIGSAVPVKFVRDTDKLLVAFRVIRDTFVSAVPVYDADDNLVGTLSAKDLRDVMLNAEMFAFLRLPVTSFPHLSKNQGMTCSKSETLRMVTERLIVTKVHRLWITTKSDDGKEKVTGVVSLRDILSTVATTPKDDPFVHYFQ